MNEEGGLEVAEARDPRREREANLQGLKRRLAGNPVIVPQSEHGIRLEDVDGDAVKVVRRLVSAGYLAFVVGGGVRDLLLGKAPKDFDIGTSATPEQIRSVFRNSRIIGRRFRIAHVFFRDRKVLEVTTFRAASEPDEEPGLVQNDNEYGDSETDAFRRDLTINGLFYDVITESVIDYVGGLEDLRAGVVKVIGDPYVRFREDPVRMIRVMRHAARTGFVIEGTAFDAILELKGLLADCSQARVFDEFSKDLLGGHAYGAFTLLREGGLLSVISAPLAEVCEADWPGASQVLKAIDRTKSARHGTPLSVALLALVFGVIADFFEGVDRELSTKDSERFFALWSGEYGDLTVRHEMPSAELTRLLNKSVNALFHPIGVSRKDREHMVHLLFARESLVRASVEGTPKAARHIRGIEDAVTFLRLTNFGDEDERAVDFWGNSPSEVLRQGGDKKRPLLRPSAGRRV